MNRLDVTEKIISTKVSKGIKWDDVAKKVGLSKEWWTSHATVDKLKHQMDFPRCSRQLGPMISS